MKQYTNCLAHLTRARNNYSSMAGKWFKPEGILRAATDQLQEFGELVQDFKR